MMSTNKLAAEQKLYQANGHLHGADNPTYLKAGSSDKMVNIALGVVSAGCLFAVLNGMKHMAYGTNKKD